MLVLTRKPGEGLVIGDEITITIVESKNGGVKIGIEAPRHVKIYRRELYDRIREENIDAASTWTIDDIVTVSENIIRRRTKK
ncbi:MAG: carbon storage regulator CsrA [Desulfobulbaceae bacterium]|nr:carbon storage regulator CsrA [Desulfobulbaceae bacterium]